MCCEDPPPDFTLLGPPPKPPWLSYQLHCDGEGLVLQHDHSSALPSSGKGTAAGATETYNLNFTSSTYGPESPAITESSGHESPTITENSNPVTTPTDVTENSSVLDPFKSITTDPLDEYQNSMYQGQSAEGVSKSTLNIIAIVLFSLAAVFLILAVLILWHKRKLLKKPQVDPRDGVEEDNQYLYNLRIRGKLWKLPPRVAMIFQPKSFKDKAVMSSNTEIPTKYVTEGATGEAMGSETSFIEEKVRDSICEVETSHPEHMTQIYMPYSSLDRRSSTTSGISSDGEMRSGAEYSAFCYNTEDSPYRVKPVKRPRSKARRFNVRKAAEDGELGDVEGSLESLADREKRYNKERQIQKARPNPQSVRPVRNQARIVVHDDDPDTFGICQATQPPPERPQSAIIASNIVPAERGESRGSRVRRGFLQVFSKPPIPMLGLRAAAQNTDDDPVEMDRYRGGPQLRSREKKAEPVAEKMETSSKSKKRRQRSNAGESRSIEKCNNVENELRESNA